MRKVLLILALVVQGSIQAKLLAQSSLPANLPPAKFHLYLLAGQSNMAGRGTVETVDKTPHPRVWVLNKEGQWIPATDPLHFDKPDVVGVGPGLVFGKQLAEADTSVFIGLIPAAAGGSAISSWQPGGYHDQTKSHPYDDAIIRAKLAQKTGTLRGIIWHQGESDSKPELASVYEKNLEQLIQRFRTEFHNPQLPIVVGTLGDFYVSRTPGGSTINAILQNLPNHIQNLTCVDAAGLTDKGDKTHFDAPSARELGHRYANAMINLEKASGKK